MRFHLIIDAKKVKKKLLNDPILLEEVSIEVAKLAKMKILLGPEVVEGVPKNPGLTCFSIIDFSHISLHTFTKTGELSFDLFSCKEFDYGEVQKFIYDIFQLDLENVEVKTID